MGERTKRGVREGNRMMREGRRGRGEGKRGRGTARGRETIHYKRGS